MPPNTLHVVMQEAIHSAISDPSFSASLPPLSEGAWLKILENTSISRAQNDRLEFMGDALMYATLGRQLYRRIPDGTAGLYTTARAVLHSNATFSRLAEKFDILAVSRVVLDALTVRTFGEGSSAPEKSRQEIKATGDLFETVIGAYYLERGFESLSKWVGELYAPLIETAEQVYRDNTRPKKSKNALPAPVQQGDVGPLTRKPRPGASPPRGPKQKRKLKIQLGLSKDSVLSPVKARLLALTRSPPLHTSPIASTPTRRKMPRLPLALRLTTPKHSLLKQKPLYIDLTLSDDEDISSPPDRKPKVSSRPQAGSATAAQLPHVNSGFTNGEGRDNDGEHQLERMLLSNNSDMDLGSSDYE